MLKVIIDIVSSLLLSDTWEFEWTITDNPKLLGVIKDAMEDGRLGNKEVGLILKEIQKEL